MTSPDDESPRPSTPPAPVRWIWGALAVVVLGAVALTLIITTRRQPPSPTGTPATAVSSLPASLPDFEVNAVSVLEGDANWYDVPENSLPRRRAWRGEFTAASNRIPLDTYVRVRRLDSRGDPNKSIVVRITDDGVSRKATVIDLNREAADALGMVKAGQLRVRVEILALKHASTDKPVEKKDATSKATELTDQPTADQRQEKDAANAKIDGESAP